MSINATELPILFSGPMVVVILEGRKTQMRRVDHFVGVNKMVPDQLRDATKMMEVQP